MSRDIEFACEACGQRLVVDESGIELFVKCPVCGKEIEIPDPDKILLPYLEDETHLASAPNSFGPPGKEVLGEARILQQSHDGPPDIDKLIWGVLFIAGIIIVSICINNFLQPDPTIKGKRLSAWVNMLSDRDINFRLDALDAIYLANPKECKRARKVLKMKVENKDESVGVRARAAALLATRFYTEILILNDEEAEKKKLVYEGLIPVDILLLDIQYEEGYLWRSLIQDSFFYLGENDRKTAIDGAIKTIEDLGSGYIDGSSISGIKEKQERTKKGGRIMGCLAHLSPNKNDSDRLERELKRLEKRDFQSMYYYSAYRFYELEQDLKKMNGN